MKLGPLTLPFSNASGFAGFALATVAVIAIFRAMPLPASLARYKP